MYNAEAWTFAVHTIRNVCVEKKGRWLERTVTAYRKRGHLARAHITVTPLSDRWLSDYDAESVKRRADR